MKNDDSNVLTLIRVVSSQQLSVTALTLWRWHGGSAAVEPAWPPAPPWVSLPGCEPAWRWRCWLVGNRVVPTADSWSPPFLVEMASAARSNLHRKSSAPLNHEPGKKKSIELCKTSFDCFIGHASFSFTLTLTMNALPWLSCRCWLRCPGWCAESRWVHSVFAEPPAETSLKLTTAERSRQTTFNPHSRPTLTIKVWNWRLMTVSHKWVCCLVFLTSNRSGTLVFRDSVPPQYRYDIIICTRATNLRDQGSAGYFIY